MEIALRTQNKEETFIQDNQLNLGLVRVLIYLSHNLSFPSSLLQVNMAEAQLWAEEATKTVFPPLVEGYIISPIWADH